MKLEIVNLRHVQSYWRLKKGFGANNELPVYSKCTGMLRESYQSSKKTSFIFSTISFGYFQKNIGLTFLSIHFYPI